MLTKAGECYQQFVFKHIFREYGWATFWVAGLALAFHAPAFAQSAKGSLPMDRVYQGPIQLPDFNGRDREFSRIRTRISNEMKTGPNFAGHYAVIEIGCGTSCRFVYVADVATGQVFNFPYGGEDYYMLDLRYGVKSSYIIVKWIDAEKCYSDILAWNGAQFRSTNIRIVGNRQLCDL